MRAKSMVLILVALGCGLVATIGVSQVMKENSQADAAPMGPIVVSITDLDQNVPIPLEGVKVEQWPLDRIPPGAVTTLEEVEGKYTKQRMFNGEPLLQRKLSDKDNDNESLNIPPGFRVAAVKVNEESAVANLINPGDHVDVIAFIKTRGAGEGVRSKTILRDIRVFAVNAETSRAQDIGEEGGRIDAKTVSLLVKPKQVQMLVLAEQLGKLELSLRHPDEEVADSSEETTTVDDLLGDGSSNGTSTQGGANWANLLKPNTPSVAPAAGMPQQHNKPFEMVVMGPDQAVKWMWRDEEELPELVGQSGSGSNRPAATPPTPAVGKLPAAIPATDLPPNLMPTPIPPAPDSAFLGN